MVVGTGDRSPTQGYDAYITNLPSVTPCYSPARPTTEKRNAYQYDNNNYITSKTNVW